MVALATGVPTWRTSPPLKIGTWNLGTHGLHHVEKVATSLETINLDISALVMTESHISSSQTSAQAEVEHHLREWSCLWSGTSTHSAGTDRALPFRQQQWQCLFEQPTTFASFLHTAFALLPTDTP